MEKAASIHQKEISTVQSKLSQAEKEIESVKSKCQIAQGVIDELKSQNKKLANDGKRDYEEKIKDLNTKLQSEKVQNSVHRDVIESMSPQIERLKCENEAHEATNKSLQEKLSQSEADLSKRKNECDFLQSKNASLEKKLDSALVSQVSSEELSKAKLDLAKKTEESDNLAVDLIQMTDKCADLEKRLESADTDLRSTETKKAELQKHCDDYSQQLSTLQEKTKQAEQTRADLDIKTAECQELQVELKATKADLTDFQTKLKELEKKHQEEVNTAESYRVSLNTAQQKLGELKEAQDESREASYQHENSMSLMEKQIQELNSQLLKAETTLADHLQQPCDDCKSKLETIADQALELKQSQTDVGKVTDQMHSLNSKLSSSEERCSKLQSQVLSLEDTILKGSAKMESQDQTLAELQALVICAAKDIQGLENEKQVLADKLLAAEKHQKSLEGDLKKLETERHSSASQTSQQQSLLSSLKTQVVNLNSELNNSNQQNDRTVDTLKKQIYSLTQEKTTLQNRNDKLVIEVDKILSEKQVYIDEIEQLASELKSNKQSTADRISSLQATVEEQTLRLNELNNIEATGDEGESDLTAKVTELKEVNSKLQHELDSMSLTLSEVMQERDELSDKIDQAETDNSNDCGNLQTKLKEVQSDYDNLAKQVHDSARENHRLVGQVSALEADKASLSAEVVDAKGMVSTLSQSIEEERNKGIYLTNKQNEKYKADMEVLQESLKDMSEERDELKRRLAAIKKPNDDTPHITNLSAKVSELQSQNDHLNQHLEQLQNEHLDQLSSASAESSILQAQLENMTEAMEDMQKEVKLTANLKSLSTELQNRLKDEKKAHAETSLELQSIKVEQMTFKEQVEDLKEKLEHAQQKCEELAKELEQNESCISSKEEQHQHQLTDLNQQASEYQQKIEKLQDQVQSLQSEANDSSAMDSLREDLEELKRVVAMKGEEIERINAEKSDMVDHLSNEKTKSEELSNELMDAQLRITELNARLEDRTEIMRLQSQLEEQKAATELARAAVNALKETPVQAEEIDELRSKVSGQEEYIQALQSDSKMLTDQVEFMKTENDDLTGRVTDLYETVGELEGITAKNERLSEECDHLKDRLTASDKRIDELTNQLNVMESKKRSIEDELEEVRTNNLGLVAQLGEAKEQAKRDAENLLESQLKEDMEANVRRLENKIRSQDQALDLLRQDNDELNAQLKLSSHDSTAKVSSSLFQLDDVDELRMVLQEKDAKLSELEKSFEVHKTYHAAAEQVTEEKVVKLTEQIKEKDKKCLELEEKIVSLQQQLDEFLAEDSESDSEEVDYKRKYQQARNQIEVLEFDYASVEAKYKDATDAKIDLGLQVASLKGERDRLAAQVRASPRMDQDNADGVEYRGLQRQIIDLKQKLQNQRKESEGFDLEKSDFERKLQVEKNATQEAKEATSAAEAEVRKLQMSISVLMNSHETEMSSLQKALHNAGAKMGDLEVRVADYSQHSDDVQHLIGNVNTELKEIKAAKESISSLMSDLVRQNNSATTQFQRQLCTLLNQISTKQEAEERTSDLSMSLPLDAPLQSTLHDIETIPNLSSTPAPDLNASLALSTKTEPLSTVSHYGRLSKEDLVAKLSDQTKHELILRKTLDESRQSLAFYRSAIDNIIDCLGTSMPGVKKWANDFLNVSTMYYSYSM